MATMEPTAESGARSDGDSQIRSMCTFEMVHPSAFRFGLVKWLIWLLFFECGPKVQGWYGTCRLWAVGRGCRVEYRRLTLPGPGSEAAELRMYYAT